MAAIVAMQLAVLTAALLVGTATGQRPHLQHPEHMGSAPLHNGLAQTPPMGWLAWEHFRCNVDCANDPHNCISEKLFMDMADRLVEDGFLEAGYEYVGIDDCWMAKERAEDGTMLADPERFPHGIKWLADYVHAKGLKLGLYADIGTKTCEKYPGMRGYEQLDAQTFASWEIDYLKVDGCNANFDDYPVLYPSLGKLLNQTGRPIIYSCSWPAYWHYMPRKFQEARTGYQVPYQAMRDAGCNLWRNWRDIATSWSSIKQVIMYWLEASHTSPGFTDIANPGSWNDPDMILIGNDKISTANARAQMAMWSIFSAPLLMSNDLRSITKDARDILLNTEVIAVNQDPAGRQGSPLLCPYKNCRLYQVWGKLLSDGSLAVAMLNLSVITANICITWTELGWDAQVTCFVRNLFTKQYIGRQHEKLCQPVDAQSAGLFKIAVEHKFEVA